MARSRKPRKAAAKPMRYVRGADFRAQRHAIAPAVAYSIPEATLLGQFVEAAYAMYAAHPDTLTPPPSTNFPNGYRLLAGIGMRDFIFASTDHVFYGFVAQSTSAENEFVVAIRGTQGGIEWWDDLNAIVLTPFRVPGCGKVGAGFARVYDTIELAPYASAPSANAPSAERNRGFPEACRNRSRRLFRAICPQGRRDGPRPQPPPFPSPATASGRPSPRFMCLRTPRRSGCRPRWSALSHRLASATRASSRPLTGSVSPPGVSPTARTLCPSSRPNSSGSDM